MTALIWSVFANKEQARELASALLERDLIACANMIDSIESVFIWKGAVENSQECGVIFKTDESLLEKAVALIEQLHPYETPAVMGWKCSEAGTATKKWLGALAGGGEIDGNGET